MFAVLPTCENRVRAWWLSHNCFCSPENIEHVTLVFFVGRRQVVVKAPLTIELPREGGPASSIGNAGLHGYQVIANAYTIPARAGDDRSNSVIVLLAQDIVPSLPRLIFAKVAGWSKITLSG